MPLSFSYTSNFKKFIYLRTTNGDKCDRSHSAKLHKAVVWRVLRGNENANTCTCLEILKQFLRYAF